MIGQTIHHYQILEKLGEGGMGVVYKAKDTALNRLVALKFLPTHVTKDEVTRKRFIVEAQAASALDHQHICNIHEINETADGQLFICMTYYEGISLRQKIEKRPVPYAEAIEIFLQIAEGLKAAHDQKIIHRDIKPGNIIITDKDEVKIVDFGLAKLAGMEMTRSTSSKGTTAYMCPEQVRGQKVDHRCDLWALGIVLYEMLTGHLPFEGEYPEPLMYAIVNEKAKSLSQYLKDAPPLLQTIIDQLLHKDPAKRYQNVSDLLVDLSALAKKSVPADIKRKRKMRIPRLAKTSFIYGGIIILLFIVFFYLLKPFLYTEYDPKVVVIPVNNALQDPTQDWFGDGVTNDIITQLAQFENLLIIENAISLSYKGSEKTSQEIAAELGVDYIIDVSVTRQQNQINIATRLLQPPNDTYIWSNNYQEEIKNFNYLKIEIIRDIAKQVEIKITAQEEERLAEIRQVNPETLKLYYQGMALINKRAPSAVQKGMALLYKAVEIDSMEPLAHAGLSVGWGIIAHTPIPAIHAQRLCKKEALKALELDDNLAEAHLALAMVRVYNDFDLIGAGKSYRRALELNPNHAFALMHYAWYLFLMENSERAVQYMQKAIDVAPISSFYLTEMALLRYMRKEYDQTIKIAQKAVDLAPDFPISLNVLGTGYAAKGMYELAITVQQRSVAITPYTKWGLGYTYALAGYNDEAQQIADELEKQSLFWDTWCLAVIYSGLGDKEKVFYWLDQAYQQRHPYVQWFIRNHFFDAYKEDPRYINLARKLNLPE